MMYQFIKKLSVIAPIFFMLLIFVIGCTPPIYSDHSFDSSRALKDIEKQIGFGPRIPGSLAHFQTREYITNELVKSGWAIRTQEFISLGHKGFNIIATRATGGPAILLGAHYDTRLFADKDPDPNKRGLPVPGANDGASGVAILLEIGRNLPVNITDVGLIFFDLEDNGRIDSWDWIMGSTAFVDKMEYVPKAMIVVDMVGEKDSSFYFEEYSDGNLNEQVWEKARQLGFSDTFIAESGPAIIDDHLPFRLKGIPAIDIIDISYPYWHTTDDTLDKISTDTLYKVGITLLIWIKDNSFCIEAENCK